MRTYIDTGTSIAEMGSESRPRSTLDLDSDNFQSQETNSTASEHQVSRGMAHSVRAIYSTRLALFIHGITSAKRTREVRPAVVSQATPFNLREQGVVTAMYPVLPPATAIKIFDRQILLLIA